MFAMFGTVVAAAALCLSQALGAGQDNGLTNPSEMIAIDGSRNPEMIPEYMVWEHGFSGLAFIKARQIKAALDSLMLSPEDAARVFKEADAQADRDRRRSERELERRTALRDAKPADLGAALRDVILEYRWEVLHARDRLLASLSAEGQAEVLRWMNERRTHITAYVPKGELDFFRQPR